MLKHSIKIALRNLKKRRTFYFINILGLAGSLAVGLLIFQYIHFEKNYDKFHENSDNIYRLTLQTVDNGVNIETSVFGTYGFGESGREQIPEIQELVRVHPQEEGIVFANQKNQRVYQEENIWFVDENFFDVFTYPIKFGTKENFLRGKQNIIITESIATKYFGAEDPTGKSISVNGGWLTNTYIVSGVIRDIPPNSHMQFDFLLPMKLLLENNRLYRDIDHGWRFEKFVTYILLNSSTDLSIIGKKFDDIVMKNKPDLLQSGKLVRTGFQKLTDIHLHSNFVRDLSKNHGNPQSIYFFTIVAILIVFIAWINFINLTIAYAIHRAKEVGIRKAVGAKRNELIGMFITEAFMLNCISSILAIGLAFLLKNYFNFLIGQDLSLTILYGAEFWIWYLILLVIGSISLGIYPAFHISSFKPISISQTMRFSYNRSVLRSYLIVFQFAISLFLASGALLVYNQIIYMQNKDLGFDIEKILVVKGPRVILELARQDRHEELASRHQTFKNEISKYPAISNVSATSSVPVNGYFWSGGVRKAGIAGESEKEAGIVLIDENFLDTYGLELIAGKNIKDNMVWYRDGVLVNEQAVNKFGLGTPSNALEEKLVMSVGDTLKIVGVVKNFHWNSLKDAHIPLILGPDYYHGYFSIRMNVNVSGTIDHIKSTFQTVFPKDPFEYFFLDSEFDTQYKADIHFRNSFFSFTIFAIFIAILGLYAMVSFSTNFRKREVAIKKVLGASIGSVMFNMSREYLILLIIANILTVPIILYFGNAWLDNFAFQSPIGISIFLIPGITLLVVSLLAVINKIYLSANANPVDSLRSE